MKKFALFAGTILLLLSSIELKAQIDNRNNYSPEWVRTAVRNASINGADAAVFNPGGVSFMKDGIHISLGNQMLFRSPEHTYTLGDIQTTRTQDGNDLVFPSFFATYKKNNLGISAGVFVAGGGATANFPEGSFSTDVLGLGAVMGTMGAYTQAVDQYLEASSYYLTSMLGASYKITDHIGVGANLRYVTAQNSTRAGFTLSGSPIMLPDTPVVIDVDQSGTAWAGSFGIYAEPNDKLSISVRYDMMVPLEFENEVKTDDSGMFEDGGTSNRDLPAVLATGIAYSFTERLRAQANYNYYFQTNADWGTSTMVTNERAISDMAGNASSVGLGIEYDINDAFTWSVGGLYTILDFDDEAGYYTTLGAFETVPGDNTSIHTGIQYMITDKIGVNAGVAHVMWEKDRETQALMLQPMDVKVETNNSMTAFGFGLSLKL